MNKNFDYLGNQFQIQLLNQIIEDKDFSSSIMDVIESSYFDNKYFKIILQMIKELTPKTTANVQTGSLGLVDFSFSSCQKKFIK